MTIFLIILACVVWYAIGFWGFIWNWTRKYDFESNGWGTAIVLGFSGVVSFLILWAVLRPEKSIRVVFPQRKRRGSA